MPLYGKLADVFGRRRIFLFGIVLFLIGSTLCGLAQTMTQLIIFRAIQGLGAGAVMPSIFTVVADLYRLHERARGAGRLQRALGHRVAGRAGPGAWLTLTWSWRSVFFVGIPFGLAAAIVFMRFFKERVEPRKVSLDVAGLAAADGRADGAAAGDDEGSGGAGLALAAGSAAAGRQRGAAGRVRRGERRAPIRSCRSRCSRFA